MAVIHDKLSEEKLEEIKSFEQSRTKELEDMRRPLDDDIEEEIDLTNDKDKFVEAKEDWEEKHTVPYIYTIVQTTVARLSETFFGKDNQIRIFADDDRFIDIEKGIEDWAQFEMDKVGFKDTSRDFFEDGLIKRTAWIQLRPVPHPKKKKRIMMVDYDVYDWYDVWFDTKARKTSETDFIIRKRIKLYELMQNEKHYFNLDKIKGTIPPDDVKKRQEYEAEHGVSYYDPVKNNVTDEVEVREHYIVYDISENPEKPDFKPCIIAMANGAEVIRIETIDNGFQLNDFLIFPIRPMKQAKSLIGKSVPQVVKKLQYSLNEVFSLTMDNLKLQTKLLFKYKKDGSIDFDELFAKGGNAIGWEDNVKDIDLFEVPNLVPLGTGFMSQLIQFMQQTTGAVDHILGTSAGRGITETAKGIQTITEQALFKFNMMAENVYGDLKKVINYSMMLMMRYGDKKEIGKRFGIQKLMKVDIDEIESSLLFDIALNDLAQRRDIKRAQFVNAINIIGGLMQGINPTEGGGNVKLLLKQVMQQFDMKEIDKILDPDPKTKKALENQAKLAEAINQGGGVPGGPGPVAPGEPPAPESEENNPIPGT